MIPYITFREEQDGELKYYILQKAFPHFLGVITTRPIEGSVLQVPVSGYDLWITFAGTIRGNIIPSYTNIMDEMKIVYSEMAAWFYAERILKEPKKYIKWKFS